MAVKINHINIPDLALLLAVDDVPVAIHKDADGNSVATAFDGAATRPFPIDVAIGRGTRISHADFEQLIAPVSDWRDQ